MTDRQQIPIRRTDPSAQDDVRVVDEEKIIEHRIKTHERFQNVNIRKSVHYVGLAIVLLVTLACLYAFLNDAGNKAYDDAVKFLSLILGAILGTVYSHHNSGEKH